MEDQMQKRFNALSFEGKRQLMEVADMLKETYEISRQARDDILA